MNFSNKVLQKCLTSTAEKLMEKTGADGMEQMQEPKLSEDMMAFAFAMGE